MAGCRRRAPGDHPAPSAARLPACRVKRRTCPTCSCAPSRPSGGPAGCPGLSSPVPSPSKEARSQSRRSSPFSSPSKGSSWKPLASVPPLTEPSPPPWGCVYRLRSHVVSPAAFSRSFFFFFNSYLFMIVTERERGRDTGRGRSRLPAGNPMRAHEPRVPLPPPQPPPRIQPREEGSRPTTEPPRRPSLFSFLLSVNLPAFRLHLRLFLHLGFVLENRLCPWLPPSQPSERGGVGWASVLVLVRACGLGISGVRLPGLLSPSSS